MLNRIKSNNSKIEYVSINNWIIKVINEQIALTNKTDNIYFLWGVRNNLVYNWRNRAKEIDIVEKNYVVIDLDIRKKFEEKYNDSLSDEDIIQIWLDIAENLKYRDVILADFDYIVFSWNWLHIYYFWDYKNISPDDYSFWVERLYNRWNDFWWDEIYYADPACKNISRILRLPWSINQKTWWVCKIIFERKWSWRIFNAIEQMWKIQKQEYIKKRELENKKRIEEYEIKTKINRLIQWTKYNDKKEKLEKIFEIIDSIPAYIVAQKILPEYKLSKNWKNFDNLKRWYTGYYYVKDLNAICNWWSRHFNWWDVNSCYSPSVLIKNQYNYSWWEVINYFKQNFKLNF